ncbi:glutathione S-transferase family protein [Pseudoroseomonas cervicalis]|uniref:glutathione S-transferase family protein n=1 Tax=Teichococcus cervicalis TaxID=204525 RepID=UPI0022F16505|nr:glutathione S-transferase [Pseudoroseomonas cervicalis]WBV44271.1 glutathione S-transferase [Pseudoroseomonas cervicalis]
MTEPTLTVHHLNNSRSQRVLWLLEELEVPYALKLYQRDPKTMRAPPELREVHPLGKAPVVTDGPHTLAETGAILEYILDRHDTRGLRPAPGTQAHLDYRYWLHFAEGSAMPPLVMTLVLRRVPSQLPFLLRPIGRAIGKGVEKGFLGPQVAGNLALMESALAQGWFAGDSFSAADVQMSFPVEATAARFGLQPYPKLADWLQRIQARPAYRRALEKGGPYAYA